MMRLVAELAEEQVILVDEQDQETGLMRRSKPIAWVNFIGRSQCSFSIQEAGCCSSNELPPSTIQHCCGPMHAAATPDR
jgi:hypothetical protein